MNTGFACASFPKLASVRAVMAAFALLMFMATDSLAGGRVALVVGNGAYLHAATLLNPRSDAGAIGAKLRKLGFEVFGGTDLDRSSFVRELVRFGRASADADVALVYYAGHGVQVNGQNYVVPVDAQVESEAEVEFSLVSLRQVLQQLDRGSRINIVFLDACRDNPFAAQLSKSDGRRTVQVPVRGLSPVQSVASTFVAYATQPDSAAEDGSGEHSPFTSALLRRIDTPGESLSDLMIEVRKDVIAATGGRQIPWDSSSLTDRFSFTSAGPVERVSSDADPRPPPADPQMIEIAVWTSIQGSNDPAVLRKFLQDFPNGLFSVAAQSRLNALTAPPQAGPAQTADAEPSPIAYPGPASKGAAQPSFDCTKSSAEIERLICADGELAHWDAQLGQAFRKKYSSMSTAEKARLLGEQSKWLEDRTKTCIELGEARSASASTKTSCVLKWTKLRVETLIP